MSRIVSYTWVRFVCKLWDEVGQFSVQINTYAERRSKRAIDQYAFQLSAILKTEEARLHKQRRALKQIHEDLKELDLRGPTTGSRRSRGYGGRVKLSGSIRQANEHPVDQFSVQYNSCKTLAILFEER